jgi:twitching motility protein PilT
VTALTIDHLLQEMLGLGASDLHVRCTQPPKVRVHGEMRRLGNHPPLSVDDVKTLMDPLLTKDRRGTFESRKSVDFSHALVGEGRFRVNFFHERRGWGCVLRHIPEHIPQLFELGAPSALLKFTKLKRGLVLVTGPTGSGKSTTLAAMLDVINTERSEHVLTIEDPIEFVHPTKRCEWIQREVPTDTPTFQQGLEDGLREDPDVILLGEMRGLETMRTALHAAESGHLVLATLHTRSAPDTISRIVGSFPEGEQPQIRIALSSAIEGIVCQSLLPTADGKGRVAAHEVLLANTAVRAAIRENKMAGVRTVLQTQGSAGMQTLDKALVDLVARGVIDPELARENAQEVKEFDQLLQRVRRGDRIDIPPKITRADLATTMSAAQPTAVTAPQAQAPRAPGAPPPIAPMPTTPMGKPAPAPTQPVRPPMPPAAAPQSMPMAPAPGTPPPGTPPLVAADDDDDDLLTPEIFRN